MDSRCFIFTLLFAAVATLAPLRAAEVLKPNFILINIDDMGYADIEPFGSKLNRTPHLSRLAAEGMKLTSFTPRPFARRRARR